MLSELLARIARTLADAGIDYMVIGGQAVLVHGEPRLTKDIDVTLGASLDRLEDVIALIERARLRALVDPRSFARDTFVIPCEDPPSGLRVDLILSNSPYELAALQRAQAVEVGGATVRFVSPEDLVIHKVIAGRPRDLEDVRGVLLKNRQLDRAWIERWLREYGAVLEADLIARFEELET